MFLGSDVIHTPAKQLVASPGANQINSNGLFWRLKTVLHQSPHRLSNQHRWRILWFLPMALLRGLLWPYAMAILTHHATGHGSLWVPLTLDASQHVKLTATTQQRFQPGQEYTKRFDHGQMLQGPTAILVTRSMAVGPLLLDHRIKIRSLPYDQYYCESLWGQHHESRNANPIGQKTIIKLSTIINHH